MPVCAASRSSVDRARNAELEKIAGLIHDQADDPANAVKVLIKKPMERGMKLAPNWSTR